MIAFPNAKINLGLNITEKRPDGFHNIETVFYPIDLYDVLEIIKATDGQTSFRSTGLDIPGSQKHNLCLKAYNLLKEKYDLPAVKIHLHKVIPMGAGLGGGSSDAAFTLKLLNNLFALKLTENELLKFASSLGADCSFFILNKAVAANKKGDQFSLINFSLKGYLLVLIVPEIHVNTAFAYSRVKPMKSNQFPSKTISHDMKDWKKSLFNDFEASVFIDHPELALIKSTLYKEGALYASLSGSGSAVFGLFENAIDLTEKFKGNFYWSKQF